MHPQGRRIKTIVANLALEIPRASDGSRELALVESLLPMGIDAPLLVGDVLLSASSVVLVSGMGSYVLSLSKSAMM